jgi:tRNA(fMet)-specific endonuclease VapC
MPIRREHLKQFQQFLKPFTLLNLNEPIMQRFAEIRSYLRRRGELIADFDILLAATAQYHQLTILTYNKRHFRRIPQVKIA